MALGALEVGRRALAVRSLVAGLVRRARPGDDRPDAGAFRVALRDPARFAEAIDRLYERQGFGSRPHELSQGGVSLRSVAVHRDEVARALARSIAAGDYRFEPAVRRSVQVDGKRRIVYALGLTDRLVHEVAVGALERAVAPTLSPQLFSYRPGVAWWRAPMDFAAYVRAHRRSTPPLRRGLYVIRRDIASYTDTIPVDEGSPVWSLLRETLGSPRGSAIAADDWAVIEAVVRPEVRGDGEVERMERGVPTGQPVSCLLFNLYLNDLDHELAAITGAFYARYSDDILFAHPDPDIADRVASLLAARVEARGLALNVAKSRDLYLTAAGHPSAQRPQVTGSTRVTFLGLAVTGDGTVALETAKARRLVRDLSRRAAAAVGAARSEAEAARLACAVVRRALTADHPESSTAAAALVQRVVTDRHQLADLDHRIALGVASAISGERSVRAFRRYPPRVLRERYGLPSLVRDRNRG